MFRQACLYSENLGEGIGVRGYRVKKNPIYFPIAIEYSDPIGTLKGKFAVILRHSQTRAESAHAVTLETLINAPSKFCHTHKRINK